MYLYQIKVRRQRSLYSLEGSHIPLSPLGSEKAELDRDIGQEVHHLAAVPEWKHGLGVEPGLAANQVVV